MDSLRDWGYAKDYVECMWLILQQDEPDDYVIATGVQHTVREFTTLAFANDGIELEWKGEGMDENCTVYQQVTIGQKNGEYPVIGNNVTIYPGARILGGITVGDNSIIAPNSVVIHDVSDNDTVAGVPAKSIRREGRV